MFPKVLRSVAKNKEGEDKLINFYKLLRKFKMKKMLSKCLYWKFLTKTSMYLKLMKFLYCLYF